jgi:dissimilatory sulfite reductase (desulfoviridin) alpha/beta subunit
MELFKIEACMGNKGCPNSANNTSLLIEKILEISQQENITDFIASKVKGPIRQHNCFKVGVANCPNACSQVQITDFAVIGKVKVEIDKSSCINCGRCVKFCFENALILSNGELEFNISNCIGCGMCVKACKEESIKITKKGFKISAGGKLGRHAMLAIDISDFAAETETLEIFRKILKFYKKHSIAGERLGAIFQRLNIKNTADLSECIRNIRI